MTGGAGGIGLAITERLVSDGYEVIVGDIDSEAGARVAERLPITFHFLDAGVETSLREFVSACGPLYLLVNNVGIRGQTGHMWEIPIADFRRTFEVNTFSHLLASQLVAPAMIEAGGGVIITIASGAARTGVAGRAPYGMSEWALLGLTKSLAHELAPWHVRANAILPGNVSGERFMGSMRLHAEAEGLTEGEVLGRFMALAPLKRLIEPAEIAGAVPTLRATTRLESPGSSLTSTGVGTDDEADPRSGRTLRLPRSDLISGVLSPPRIS